MDPRNGSPSVDDIPETPSGSDRDPIQATTGGTATAGNLPSCGSRCPKDVAEPQGPAKTGTRSPPV